MYFYCNNQLSHVYINQNTYKDCQLLYLVYNWSFQRKNYAKKIGFDIPIFLKDKTSVFYQMIKTGSKEQGRIMTYYFICKSTSQDKRISPIITSTMNSTNMGSVNTGFTHL